MREPRLKPRELEALADVVGERMGLHYPPAKWPDLERALAMAAPQAGFKSLGDLVTAILTDTASEERLGSLASCLTVGETYFFRDPRSFSALEQQVLPELARIRAAAGVLRIWSAGCSDGAEPYSIAISCARALPLCGSLEVKILATDIDHRALDRARSAVYAKWSLRDMPPAVVRDYFRARGDQSFELRAGIRDKVRFAYQNLVAADQMRLAETTNVDLIFCRNVLMYFSPHQLGSRPTDCRSPWRKAATCLSHRARSPASSFHSWSWCRSPECSASRRRSRCRASPQRLRKPRPRSCHRAATGSRAGSPSSGLPCPPRQAASGSSRIERRMQRLWRRACLRKRRRSPTPGGRQKRSLCARGSRRR